MKNIDPKSLDDLIKSLESASKAGKFPNFIKYLRLHSFKNISDITRIDFNFPVTALVGANGCGKSSVLQALYGSPDGHSLGKYWFSTKLDPISDDSVSRPYLVYGYLSASGVECEVVKTRIKWDKKAGSSQNMDYWEPSRPLAKLGMKKLPGGGRHPAVSKDVMVIDFRYQLSAFDRYFYLEDVERYHQKKRRHKQDVIRMRSVKILEALEGRVTKSDERKIEKACILTEDQCEVISTILGKRYRSGKILHHKFHGFWADTVVFESESAINPLRYTEANAGSGEVAVALLIHKLANAHEGSLILLDEPEYSLHPGAQHELLKYLVRESLRKKMQIVFTTHSPAMLKGLPPSAIKVFEQDPASDKFMIHQDRNAEEAFFSIGQRSPLKAMIRVEDALAKELLLEILNGMVKKNTMSSDFINLIDITYYPGGVSSMKQDMALYSRENRMNVFTVFDGTETPKITLSPTLFILSDREQESLKKNLVKLVGEDIRFAVDGKDGKGRSDQWISAAESYIGYWNKRARFLPFNAPEENIWSEDLARSELDCVCTNSSEVDLHLNKINNLDPKGRFAYLAKVTLNRDKSEHILALQTKFLKNWLKSEKPELKLIEQLLLEIRKELY